MNAGEVFGVVGLVLFIPYSVIGTIVFYSRRTLQPIKARSPALVVVTNVILGCYAVLLCIQRIIGDDYPCLLNLWSAFAGTIVLGTAYIIRAWALFFNYFLTQQRMQQGTEALTRKSTQDKFFLLNKKYIDMVYLVKVSIITFIILMVPCVVLSATNDEIPDERGDECDRRWGDWVLLAYVALFVGIFMWFGWRMREVVDGFFIKDELRWTGIFGVLTVIVWVVFNNWAEKVNNDVFPFSTLALVLGIVAVFAFSTYLPIYRSIYQPPKLDHLDVPDDVKSLRGLLATDQGYASFKEFLAREFSVENLLFWSEVESFREKRQQGASDLEVLSEAQNIYAKYIIRGAPFEVNLPGKIVNDLMSNLKRTYGAASAGAPLSDAGSDGGGAGGSESGRRDEHKGLMLVHEMQNADGEMETVTIFDDAQRNIFGLMESDSYQRYLSSPMYRELETLFDKKRRTKEILVEQGIV